MGAQERQLPLGPLLAEHTVKFFKLNEGLLSQRGQNFGPNAGIVVRLGTTYQHFSYTSIVIVNKGLRFNNLCPSRNSQR